MAIVIIDEVLEEALDDEEPESIPPMSMPLIEL